MNFLYFIGFSILIVKSGLTTAQVSKANETNVVQNGNQSSTTTELGFESTTTSEIYKTSVKPSTIKGDATTISFEVTTNSVLAASTTIESLTTELDDYYDDFIEETSTTEASEIEDIPINNTTTPAIPTIPTVTQTQVPELSTKIEDIPIKYTTTPAILTIPTVNHTQVPESTTKNEVIVTTTTIASTTAIDSTTSSENLTTTTIASKSPKNESRPVSIGTNSNGILSAQIFNDLYIYYKMITPIILRIIFGIGVSLTKVKAAVKKPAGIAIALFCNFFYMPLVSIICNVMLK